MTPEQLLQDWRDNVTVEAPPDFSAAVRDRARSRARRSTALQAVAGVAVLAVAVTAVAVQAGDEDDALRPADQVAAIVYPSDADLASARFFFTRTLGERRNSTDVVDTAVQDATGQPLEDLRETSTDWAVRGGAYVSVRNGEPVTFDPPMETGSGKTWTQLADLPTDPEAMRAAELVVARGGATPRPVDVQNDAYGAAGLLDEPLPLAQRKAVEQAIATSPGAQDQGLRSDALGRTCREITLPAIGVSVCFSGDGALLQSEKRDRKGQLFERTLLQAIGVVGSSSEEIPSPGDPTPLPRPATPVDPFSSF